MVTEAGINKHRDIVLNKNYSQMEYTKTDLNWLMKKTEDCSNRYMEAEKFILEIAEMKWYQRVFLKGKILRFLNSRSKYNF